jgi:hypothetical protein
MKKSLTLGSYVIEMKKSLRLRRLDVDIRGRGLRLGSILNQPYY